MAPIRKDEFHAFLEQLSPHIDFNRVDLVDSGMIDSVDMLTILNGILEHYGKELDFSRLVPDCFNSVEKLYQFVTEQGE